MVGIHMVGIQHHIPVLAQHHHIQIRTMESVLARVIPQAHKATQQAAGALTKSLTRNRRTPL